VSAEQRPEEEPEAPGTRLGAVRMELDVRDGDRMETSIVAAPTADDVVSALRSLDQRRHTEMCVLDGGGAYIAIGGGGGRYHVYVAAYDHDDRIVLQAPDAGDGHEDLVVDGRRQRFAARDVVDLDCAAVAVLEFLRSGRPHPDLPWRTA
jgi:immunity protein Imm1 of predicted polymorphic toxin system